MNFYYTIVYIAKLGPGEVQFLGLLVWAYQIQTRMLSRPTAVLTELFAMIEMFYICVSDRVASSHTWLLST